MKITLLSDSAKMIVFTIKDSCEELSRKLLKLPSETKPSTRKTGRG